VSSGCAELSVTLQSSALSRRAGCAQPIFCGAAGCACGIAPVGAAPKNLSLPAYGLPGGMAALPGDHLSLFDHRLFVGIFFPLFVFWHVRKQILL